VRPVFLDEKQKLDTHWVALCKTLSAYPSQQDCGREGHLEIGAGEGGFFCNGSRMNDVCTHEEIAFYDSLYKKLPLEASCKNVVEPFRKYLFGLKKFCYQNYISIF
jgi:hypothetical protein